jgi:hypothetical protein
MMPSSTSGKEMRGVMSPATTEYCEACKAHTKRCEFYPVGRSRQHGTCLECDRKDPRRPENYRSLKPQYCYACGLNQSDRFRQ